MDIDNIIKALFDSCNQVLWNDDSQVSYVNCKKEHVGKSEEERVEITIRKVT